MVISILYPYHPLILEIIMMIMVSRSVESYLGKLLFNNMILVSKGSYYEFNIFLEKDQKYKGLFIDQVRVLRSKKNQEDISKRAQVVYKLKSRNSSYSYIQYATVDFSLLEKNM